MGELIGDAWTDPAIALCGENVLQPTARAASGMALYLPAATFAVASEGKGQALSSA